MRSGEFKAVREGLSLTVAAMAALLGVSEATVKNWEKGKYRPPAGVAIELERLEAYTRRCVDAVVSAVEGRAPKIVFVYRSVEDMPPGPAQTLGPAWWRSVAWRARERVEGLEVGYIGEVDSITGSRETTLSAAVGADSAPPVM